MGNGLCERMNRTMINMLKTLPTNFKSNWKNHIKKLTFAYNDTKHRSTNYSPYSGCPACWKNWKKCLFKKRGWKNWKKDNKFQVGAGKTENVKY